jgi:NAD(P)-dependent dehydrogenase (short-subunit alcohol dehydrogenase family)
MLRPPTTAPRIDASKLSACLDVLDLTKALPVDHPDAVVILRAVNELRRSNRRLYKQKHSPQTSQPEGTCVKEGGAAQEQPTNSTPRTLAREHQLVADRITINATVTGQRHDDETAGLSGVGGTLHIPRKCYVCKTRYTAVDWFYFALCPPCATENHERRNARVDLAGRRALVTGGRAKIGMYVVLRLLRDGAHVTITTRFPRDASRRFASMPDSAHWIDRLVIVGIDLRDPRQVLRLADMVAQAGPLDILVNNAAQTVRRSPQAYGPIIEAEDDPLPLGGPEIRVFGRYTPTVAGQQLLPTANHDADETPGFDNDNGMTLRTTSSCSIITTRLDLTRALVANPGTPDLSTIDAAGLLPDPHAQNTWSARVGDVPPVEVLEVQLCNALAPFLLLNALRPSLAASAAARKYVVNATAVEGQFEHAKTPYHAHTNMAKAGLNMLTRTAAGDLFQTDRILMTAVDTGWVTDERPWPHKVASGADGFCCPLDLEDGAARLYDPILRGENGEDVYGVLLRDYHVAPW